MSLLGTVILRKEVFMKNFKGKRVLVYGMGRSGQAASKLLHELGACVSIYDDEKNERGLFCFDEQPLLNSYDLVVVSPGVTVRGNQNLSAFAAKKVPVMSELDLGSSFCKGKILAVSGTNGKTTTCSLLGKIFERAGKEVFVCGNIGLPISSIAKKTSKKSIIVCEVSNFQLETSKTFSPQVSCLLNLQEDHLDRHGSFEEYLRVKNKLFQNYKSSQIAVVNLDDENVMKQKLPKKLCFFSLKPLKKGVFIKNGSIYCNKTRIISLSQIPLLGEKNYQNVMAAVAVASLFKIKPRFIAESISSFMPAPHRLSYLGEKNGVMFVDDSKATNIACVQMAIESLRAKNLLLLLGGQNKNLSFEKFFAQKPDIKKCYCFGEAGEEIFRTAQRFGYEAECFTTMQEAVLCAKFEAVSGDVVLLSPGCASFDEFSSYAVRGQIFMELVNEG